MPDIGVKIIDIPPATTIADTDLVMIGNPTSGVLYKIPFGLLKSFLGAKIDLAFTKHPANASVPVGSSASFFGIFIGGTPPYTAVWKLGADALVGSTSTGNGTSSSYSVSNAQNANGGNYTLEVTDSLGVKIISNVALLTVTAPVGAGLSINSLQNKSVNTGSAVTQSINASGGAGGYSYQWQKSVDGTTWANINGAIAAAFTIASAASGDAAFYRVIVGDSSGASATSNAAALTVNASTNITARWGDYPAAGLPTEANILDAPFFGDFAHNATIVADWRASVGVPRFLKLFIRNTETTPTAWVETGNPTNTAGIGAIGAFETFNILGTVTATDGGANWLVIGSYEKTDFANTVSFTH